MPFPICRHRQRGVDKRDNLLRKIRRAAIADPLRIATVHQETGSFESRHVAGHAGLAGAEFPHQFANTMLAPIPHHPEGFEPGRLCESGENCDGIHRVTYFDALMRITAYKQSSLADARPPTKSFAAAGLLTFLPRFLNWRARDVSIGAKNAAIALPGLEACPAALAHIEIHAGVGRHGFRCAMPASRARNCRDELHHISCKNSAN